MSFYFVPDIFFSAAIGRYGNNNSDNVYKIFFYEYTHFFLRSIVRQLQAESITLGKILLRNFNQSHFIDNTFF